MEMWKTAAYTDGKPIHSLWKRTGLSHRSANRFPTATPDQAVYTQSHNACCEYPSIPFLSVIKEKRNKKKRAGVQPLDEPKSCTPVYLLSNGSTQNGEQESGKQCKAVPTLRNCQFPLSRKPTVSCLLRLRPNPRRTQKLCSGTQDKSCGYAIFQIAGWQAA